LTPISPFPFIFFIFAVGFLICCSSICPPFVSYLHRPLYHWFNVCITCVSCTRSRNFSRSHATMVTLCMHACVLLATYFRNASSQHPSDSYIRIRATIDCGLHAACHVVCVCAMSVFVGNIYPWSLRLVERPQTSPRPSLPTLRVPPSHQPPTRMRFVERLRH
jgi:hypothetical protein